MRWIEDVRNGTVPFVLAHPADPVVRSLAARIIREEEGFQERAYPDGKGYSIGYGRHGAKPDEVTTERVEAAWVDKMVEYFANRLAVRFPDLKLPAPAWAVLISWMYNIGETRAFKSEIMAHMDARRFDLVDDVLVLWRNANGKPHPGLIARRAREAEVWNLAIAQMNLRESGAANPTPGIPDPEHLPMDRRVITGLGALALAALGETLERIDAIAQKLPISGLAVLLVGALLAWLWIRMLRSAERK